MIVTEEKFLVVLWTENSNRILVDNNYKIIYKDQSGVSALHAGWISLNCVKDL